MFKNKIIVLYIVFFSIAVFLPSISSICYLIVIAANFITIYTHNDKELPIISTIILGTEVYSILNIFICITALAINEELQFEKNTEHSKKLCICGTLLVGISFYNAINNSAVWNLLFYLLYLLILIVCYKSIKDKLDYSNSIDSVKYLLYLEFIITCERIIKYHILKPGDWCVGTLGNAHYFGNWIILSLIFLYSCIKNNKKNAMLCFSLLDVFLIPTSLIMLYLSDAKAILISFMLALVLYLFIEIITVKSSNAIFFTIIGMYAAFYIGLWVISLPSVKSLIIDKSPNVYPYLYTSGWNGRVNFASSTLFDSLKGIRLLTGYGLGQYGSRVSNAFAYDVMFRNDSSINNFIASNFQPSHVDKFANLVSYYNDDFVSTIQWRSAVLSYPFSSFIALIAETGMIGVIFASVWLNKTLKNAESRFAIIYFLSVCIFDLYFDNFQCVFAVIIYAFVIKANRKVNEYDT